jgi:hypothetical protein
MAAMPAWQGLRADGRKEDHDRKPGNRRAFQASMIGRNARM